MDSVICCRKSYSNYKYKRIGCKLTQFPSNIPKEAKEVDLRYNTILNLEDDAFLNLTQCTKLNMEGNILTHIKSGMFKGLQSLTDLDLRSNNISDIDPEAFLSLQECIENIWLGNNQLTCLRAGTFKGLVALDQLDLHSNQISFIEPGTFSDLPLISVLYLDNNRLVTPMAEQDLIQSQDLFLSLTKNPLFCDSRMCWIKEAERDGRIKLRGSKSQCVNYPNVHWDDIKLPCSMAVESRWNRSNITLDLLYLFNSPNNQRII